MSVLLPAPGTPVMPTRTDWPRRGSSSVSTACASCLVRRGVGFDQRDGASEHGAVAADHAVHVLPGRQVRLRASSSGIPQPPVHLGQQVLRRVGDDGAGAEDGRGAVLAQELVVLLRDDAAADDQDVAATQLPSARPPAAAAASCGRRPGCSGRRCARRSRRPAAPSRPASGTAGPRRRRSPGRRTPWPRPWRRGRARPGPSWPPAGAAAGPRARRTRRPAS